MAAGAVALLLNQSAFQAGALQASLPTLTAGEPVVGSLLGFLMLGELLTASGTLEWLAVAGSAVVTIGAVVVLSVSAARFEVELETGDDPGSEVREPG